MALYMSTATRRRRVAVVGAVALVVGLVVGFGLARVTARSFDSQVTAVQTDAQRSVAGLRVIALHDETGAVGAAGTDSAVTVIARTRDELTDALDRASWIPASRAAELLGRLDDLADAAESSGEGGSTASDSGSDGELAERAEAVAAEIEAAFGLVP